MRRGGILTRTLLTDFYIFKEIHMNAQKKTLNLVLGSAFAASVAIAPLASAAENPFVLKPLASGYMVADSHEGGEKMKDGKCGTGKCGSSMKKKAEEKAKEGSCGADKAKEGACSADKKAKEGNCSAEKAQEGKCGSGNK
jgi:uncharacterized low-complexity protein